MSTGNIRKERHKADRRAAKESGCAPLVIAPRGQTPHSQKRLEERRPTDFFPFSLKTLRDMKHRGKLEVEPAGDGRIILISKKHNFRVVTDKNIKVLITVENHE
ncbi:MAG: hypothetical protein WC619_03550 [Patescibacteria group bacterium]